MVYVTLILSDPYAVFATRIASSTHGHSSLLHRRMSLLNRSAWVFIIYLDEIYEYVSRVFAIWGVQVFSTKIHWALK